MPPRSSVTAFDLGYRSGNPRMFLDQVDMGINLGGLVHVDREPLVVERTQQHHRLTRLRLNHDAAELDLEDFISEEEELRNIKDKLQSDLSDQAKRAEDAYGQNDLSAALGLELAHKNLRVEVSVRLRDLSQKAMALLEVIKATHQKLSGIEFDIMRTECRLHVIDSQLRPVNNLGDALNA